MVLLHYGVAVIVKVDVFLKDLQRLTVYDEAEFIQSDFLNASRLLLIQIIVQIFSDEGRGADIVAVGGMEDGFQFGQF